MGDAMGTIMGDINLMYIMPEIVLVAVGIVVLLVDAFTGREAGRRAVAYVALVGALAAFASLRLAPLSAQPSMNGMFVPDGFTFFFRSVILGAVTVVILLSIEYVEKQQMAAGAFYAVLLFAATGALFMVGAGNVITFYIGLETLTIPSYVLAGMMRDERSNEAGIKYCLNGAMASAVLLYGFSLLYGATGTTDLVGMADALRTSALGPLQVSGLLMVMTGLGFKISAVPFHLWAPDTYQGAPTPVTAFLSVVSKGASFAAILRIFFVGLAPLQADWSLLFGILSVLTMTIGNISALWQTNLKRLLAYSSIAHAGYMMAGLAAGNGTGMSAVMFYVFAYAFMNLGAFATVIAIGNNGDGEEVASLNGLVRRSPWLAVAMLLFMLSLIGIPFFPGFWGKLYLFRATIEGGLTWLAIAIAVNSAISVWYYYGVIRAMFVEQGEELAAKPFHATWGVRLGLLITAAGVLVLGLMPNDFLQWVSVAALLQ